MPLSIVAKSVRREPCLLCVLISLTLAGCKKIDVKVRIDDEYSSIETELSRQDRRSAQATLSAHLKRLEKEWRSASEDSDDAKVAQGVRDRLISARNELLRPVRVESPVEVERPVKQTESPEAALQKKYEEWTKQNLPQLNLLISKVRQEIQTRLKLMEELEKIMSYHQRDAQRTLIANMPMDKFGNCKGSNQRLRNCEWIPI